MKKIIALVLTMAMLFTTAATMNVFAADEPAFVVNNVSGKPGDTVEVVVSVENNPGIVAATIELYYDSNVLELTAEPTPGADYSDMSFSQYLTDNPYSMLWFDSINPNNTANGTFATLTFKIKDTAPVGTTALTIIYGDDDPDNICNSDWDAVNFAFIDGSVTVEAEEVEEELDYEAATEEKGANIRLESATVPTGLRFATTVTKADLGIEGEYEYAEDADLIFGVYMLPEKLLEETAYDTLQALIESGEEHRALNIVAKRIYEQDDTTLTYTAVLTAIPQKDWKTTVLAVPYVLKDGVYYFANQVEDSYYEVAKKARETTYSVENIAQITDPVEKAAAEEIATKLDKIINVDEEGWIQGWY